jgi:hypothetical protein
MTAFMGTMPTRRSCYTTPTCFGNKRNIYAFELSLCLQAHLSFNPLTKANELSQILFLQKGIVQVFLRELC